MAKLTIRVDFDAGGSLGPGKVRLLEAVSQAGSIRRAADLCGMSFRQAWLLLEEAGEIFGAPLTETVRGGAKGGGTRLTALGGLVVATYRGLERAAEGATTPERSLLAAQIRAAPTGGKPRRASSRLKRKSLKK